MTIITSSEVETIFAPLAQQGQQSQFMSAVADDVHWTIQGHNPMAGIYTTKADFVKATLQVLGEEVLTEPLCIGVRNVVVGDKIVDEDVPGRGTVKGQQVVVELKAKEGTTCKNGLKYDMTYAWFLLFDSSKKIIRVRAYLDSDLLTRAINQNTK